MAAARGRLPADLLGYAIGMAGDTAARLEAARGNWSAALSVDALVLQVAEQGWGSLGAALARRGLHLRLAGRPREAEPLLVRAERESPGSVAREEETAALASPPTFGEALAAAESLMRGQPRPAVSPRDVGLLREALTAHESYSATSRLVRPAALPAQAAQLVALADCLVREGEAARAWRVAAETHLMCRAVMRCTDGSAPGRPPGLATSWCGALEVGARAALAMEEQSLLRDMKDTVRAVHAFLGPGPQDACRELLEEAWRGSTPRPLRPPGDGRAPPPGRRRHSPAAPCRTRGRARGPCAQASAESRRWAPGPVDAAARRGFDGPLPGARCRRRRRRLGAEGLCVSVEEAEAAEAAVEHG
ncbi:hypothetical protein [Streptomyces sudanensis]|uniref:hypothetical protein n=1 Tax=Streptomyces sudanensis TaxID=436397 RepID=UPI0020CE0DBA|nr:hypothetical protein [Streptomyces sudanensis]MCQ0003180.1 hypothetical protein [Streptomyces sudanensis]